MLFIVHIYSSHVYTSNVFHLLNIHFIFISCFISWEWLVYLHLIGASLICWGLVRGRCSNPHGSTAAPGSNTLAFSHISKTCIYFMLIILIHIWPFHYIHIYFMLIASIFHVLIFSLIYLFHVHIILYLFRCYICLEWCGVSAFDRCNVDLLRAGERPLRHPPWIHCSTWLQHGSIPVVLCILRIHIFTDVFIYFYIGIFNNQFCMLISFNLIDMVQCVRYEQSDLVVGLVRAGKRPCHPFPCIHCSVLLQHACSRCAVHVSHDLQDLID